MYSVASVENAVRSLYYAAIQEADYTEASVEAMLDKIDFDALAQAVRHYATTVNAYNATGKQRGAFNYRGDDLFGQQATFLFEDKDYTAACRTSAGACVLNHNYELWLLEDMSFAVTVCVEVTYGEGGYVTKYREVKDDLWSGGLCLSLEDMTSFLERLCAKVQAHELPYYEL